MRLIVSLLFALFLLPQPVSAHHGWGSYDAAGPKTLEGVIEASVFENPHTSMTLKIEGSDWLITLAPPSRMTLRGAIADVIKTGNSVKAYGYPKRDGTHEIRAEWIEVGGQHFELR